jgi:hypothetical protein
VKTFPNPQVGDFVLVYEGDKLHRVAVIRNVIERLICTGFCNDINDTNPKVFIGSFYNYFNFRKTNGNCTTGTYRAVPATRYEAVAGFAELERLAAEDKRLAEEKERLEAEQRQAEYDAMPESIKLARRLRFISNIINESKLATAPIEHLRGMIEWANANNIEKE